MTHKLGFLEELMSSPFGQKLFETYTIGTYLRNTNLSELTCLESLTDEALLVLKAMSTQFGCTVDLEKLSCLDHPNVSRVLMHGETANYFYVVKPYYQGLTLEEFVNQFGPLSARAVIDIMTDIADGVNYLHQQQPMLILRDLKPDNVIMHHNHTPVIVDLESSRAYSLKSQDTVILGTPGYASPEHFGVKETDVRSDVYLLGMLLHFMITKEVWYQRKIVHPRLMHERFNGLRQVIEIAISFDPDKRYQNVESFKEALSTCKETPELNTDKQALSVKTHWMAKPKLRTSTIILSVMLLLGTGAIGMQLVNTYMDAAQVNQTYGTESTQEQTNSASTAQNLIPKPTIAVIKSTTGDVVIYRRGDREDMKSALNANSKPRDLPLGLVQTPSGDSFVTLLNTKNLPPELADVDNIGVGGGAYSMDMHYTQVKENEESGSDFFSVYAPPGSSIIEFRSVGDYYYGNHVVLYAAKKARAIVVIGIDESVAYKILP